MKASWSVPYSSSAAAPYWGPQTSAVNFCEEDYIFTQYIGEFFNTLTSLIYVAYGYRGIRRKRRQNVAALDSINFPYWGLIGVGVCSGLYHMTLKYHTQMSDELSMHLAIGTVLNEVFTFEKPLAIQRRNTSIIVGILVPFVIYHCITDEFLLHVLLFLVMSIIVSVKTKQIIAQRITDEERRSKLSGLSTLAAGSALFGYFLWNIDVNFCSILTSWKHQIGLPWGVVLELHGWWHFFTAVGSYTFMAIIEFLISPPEDGSDAAGFLWPTTTVLRELASESAVNGSANGHAGQDKKGK